MRAILTAIFAGLLPVAGVTTAVALDATREPTEVVTTTIVTTTTSTVPVTTTKPPAPTTSAQPPLDLSGVDFAKLALLMEEEQRIARQMAIDEARMLYGRCGEWKLLAEQIGWPAEEWPIISKVLYRESRCNIGSWNRDDPATGSRGLMQINGSWCLPNKWNPHPAGWLGALGILTSCEDLFQPEVNLRAGLAIWLYGEERYGCGWRGPWATPCA